MGATRAAIAVLGEDVAFNLIESSEDIASYSEIPKGIILVHVLDPVCSHEIYIFLLNA